MRKERRVASAHSYPNVAAAGGVVFGPDGEQIRFNQPDPLLPGFVAVAGGLESDVRDFLKAYRTRG